METFFTYVTVFGKSAGSVIVHRTSASQQKRLENQEFLEEKEEEEEDRQQRLRPARTVPPQLSAWAGPAAAPPASCPSPPPARSSFWMNTWRSAHCACSVNRVATSHDSPPVPTERALTASASTCALRYQRAGWASRARSAPKRWRHWTSVPSWMTGRCWSGLRSTSWDVSWLLIQILAGALRLTAGENQTTTRSKRFFPTYFFSEQFYAYLH